MIKIDDSFIEETSRKAKTSPRKRMNFNFHKEDSSRLQRMLNAIEPGTYCQPHKHEAPDKVEAFFVLKGRVAVVEYNDHGEIIDHIVLDASKGNYGAEIPAKVWHSIISLESGTVCYEVKDGPYNPETDKNFALWAPKEGDAEVATYLEDVLAEIGYCV
ncbi:MAG: WbuC family cupin fold metalloprotein [Bacteroidales bacterium]|nr:WbuC family cupin fold metalloprotein [Bacteroidales bacterium]